MNHVKGNALTRALRRGIKQIGEVLPLALFLPFMIVGFGALELYIGNADEFFFTFGDLCRGLLMLFLPSVLVIGLIFLVLKKISPKVYAWAVLAYAALYFVLYIQGNYLLGNLPPLDGTMPDWTAYRTDTLISIGVCILIVGILVAIAKKCKIEQAVRIVKWGMTAVTFILLLTLGTGLLTSDDWKDSGEARFAATNRGIYQVSESENMIILVLDTVDSVAFTEEINNNPQWLEQFGDFVYYPDTLGCYPFTTRAIPFMLSGRWFENERDFADYSAEIYWESPLFNRLEAEDFSMGLYEDVLRGDEHVLRFENVIGESGVTSYAGLGKKMTKLVLFRYMPYGLKQRFFFNMGEFDALRQADGEEKLFTESNAVFYNGLKDKGLEIADGKRFRFIHLEGAHVPFKYNKDVEIIENSTYEQGIQASMTIAYEYIRQLQELGVYDQSTIVILADHGFVSDYRQTPLLMIKGKGQRGEWLTVSDTPVSFENLMDIYGNLLDGLQAEEAVGKVAEKAPADRRFLYYMYMEEEYMEEYISRDLAKDSSAMQPTGKTYTRKGPEGKVLSADALATYENADYDANVSIDGVQLRMDREGIIVYGWAFDEQTRSSMKHVYLEVNGQLYEAQQVYRDDLNAWEHARAYSGFTVTAPYSGAETLTLHFINDENLHLNPVSVPNEETYP